VTAKPTNPHLVETIRFLRKASRSHEATIWARLAKDLERCKNQRTVVNLSQISRALKEGEIAAVPGKVLGAGKPRNVLVAAFSFSEKARQRIEDSGGECLSLKALVERNPKGSGVRIVG